MCQGKPRQAVIEFVRYVVIVIGISSALPFASFSQTTSSSAAANPGFAVPRLVKFSGTLKDGFEIPLNGTIPVVFALYAQASDVEPIWKETQNVSFENGRYSVFLGAGTTNGIPSSLFQSGDPRWLGIRVGLDGELEHPRIFLASVPYAIKASDADTLGGLPASAFVRSGSSLEGAVVPEPLGAFASTSDVANTNAATTGRGALRNDPLIPTAASFYLDAKQFPGPTADIKITNCIRALQPNGGTCDARALGGQQVIANTITIPPRTELLLPIGGTWFCTVRNIRSSCIVMNSDSALVGLGHGANNTHIILKSTAAVSSILMLGGQGVSTHYLVQGLEITGNASSFGSGGTIENAVVELSGVYDSSLRNLSLDGFMNTRGLWIHDAGPGNGGNSIDIYSLLIDGNYNAGAQPIVISQNSASGLGEIRFFGGDFGHPGQGNSVISIAGNSAMTGASLADIFFSGSYMEGSKMDVHTPIVSISDAINVQFSGIHVLRMASGSTAYGFLISETAVGTVGNVSLRNAVVAGGKKNNFVAVKDSRGVQDPKYTDTRDAVLSNYEFLNREQLGSASITGPISYTADAVTLTTDVTVKRTIRTDSVENTDLAGQCVIGSNCELTFHGRYKRPPICVATDISAVRPVSTSVSNATLTISGEANDTVNYICIARD